MTFLGFGVLIVILWYTGRQVIEGALTLGALTSFLLYGVAIGTSLSTLAGIYGQFQEGAGCRAACLRADRRALQHHRRTRPRPAAERAGPASPSRA